MPSKKIIITMAVVAILGGLLVIFSGGSKDVTPETTLTDSAWKRGAVNSKVSLIEYGDFQCPACAAYEPIAQKLQNDFKDDLVFSYRHFPLTQIHQNALSSAKASEAAGLQNKFWEMHDLLYMNQQEWSTVIKSKEIFIGYAKTLGLDVSKFSQDLELKSIDEKIKSDYESGIKLGVQGTPTFFLDGKKIDNPRSYEDFKKLIELAK
ncbi:MAG: thioredoxin domain-containing protein [Patescibacteria group bacterium]